MHYKPLGQRLLIEQIVQEEKTKGGLIIAESVQVQFKGRVVAIGCEVKETLVGDIVLFGKNYMQGVLIDDKPYLLLKEDDIFCYDEHGRNDFVQKFEMSNGEYKVNGEVVIHNP